MILLQFLQLFHNDFVAIATSYRKLCQTDFLSPYVAVAGVKPLSPIYGKPKATSTVGEEKFVLSWDAPDYFEDAKDITYTVELCESADNWRRIRTGLTYVFYFPTTWICGHGSNGR